MKKTITKKFRVLDSKELMNVEGGVSARNFYNDVVNFIKGLFS